MLKNIADKNEHMECIWLGYIPRDWEVERLQWHLYEINDKNNPIITENILSLTNKKGVIPYEEKGDQGNKSKESIDEYKIAHKDTIVANSMNILIGSVGYCNYEGCVSPVYYVFKEKKENNLYFINYIMQTAEFQKMLRNYANGILEIRMRVSSNDILKRKVAFPSIDEQNKIVSFLDSKCQKIDDTIEKINKQIEVLKKYKQSLITEVVTKGLDKNAEMKDSEVEWIEKIPKNWERNKVKYLFNNGKGLPITKADLVEDGVPVLSYGQIHAKTNSGVNITQDLIRCVDSYFEENYPSCAVFKNDFIFADTSEDYDGCGNCCYKRDDTKLFAGYHTIILHSKCNKDNRYYAYLFKTNCWRKQLREVATGVKLFSIPQHTIMNSTIIVPSELEQIKISDFLDKKYNKIDNILDKKSKQIEILERYKKSLIYEYVTGKKRVK